jgi:hypothetical protein
MLVYYSSFIPESRAFPRGNAVLPTLWKMLLVKVPAFPEYTAHKPS